MTGPVDLEQVQRCFIGWVRKITTLPCDWAFQKHAEQNLTPGFATLTIMSLGMPPDLADDEYRTTEKAGELYDRWIGTRRLVLNVQAATNSQRPSENAMMYLSALQQSLQDDANFSGFGLTFVQDSAITNLSAIFAEGYVSRASIDLTFDVVSEFTSTSIRGWFKQAVINGKTIGLA